MKIFVAVADGYVEYGDNAGSGSVLPVVETGWGYYTNKIDLEKRVDEYNKNYPQFQPLRVMELELTN